MELKDTLEKYVMQLKNNERTLEKVASVCQKIIAKLYDTYFPRAETLRPGPVSPCPDSDIITIAWLFELIGKDSELAGYKLVKVQLGHLFPHCQNALVSIKGEGICALQAKNSEMSS